MRLKNSERDALRAILTDETLEDVDTVAQAVFDGVVALLRERTSYAATVMLGHEKVVAVGPLWDKNETKALQKKYPSVRFGLTEIQPVQALEEEC